MPPRFSLNSNLTSSVNATWLSKAYNLVVVVDEEEEYFVWWVNISFLWYCKGHTQTHVFTSLGNIIYTHTHLLSTLALYPLRYLFPFPPPRPPRVNHPLDACYNSVVVDEPQLIIVDLKPGKLRRVLLIRLLKLQVGWWWWWMVLFTLSHKKRMWEMNELTNFLTHVS
jgi:hypothetical protein